MIDLLMLLISWQTVKAKVLSFAILCIIYTASNIMNSAKALALAATFYG